MGIAKKPKQNFDCLFVKNKQKLQRGTRTASLCAGGLEPQTSFKSCRVFFHFTCCIDEPILTIYAYNNLESNHRSHRQRKETNLA